MTVRECVVWCYGKMLCVPSIDRQFFRPSSLLPETVYNIHCGPEQPHPTSPRATHSSTTTFGSLLGTPSDNVCEEV